MKATERLIEDKAKKKRIERLRGAIAREAWVSGGAEG